MAEFEDRDESAELPALDDLMFEYLELLEQRQEAPAEVLETLCAAHPSRAEELRRAAATLDRSGLLSAQAAELFPHRLGEFRLLRRLGGGGMGVVFLAEQDGIGRRVALKLIRGEQLTEASARLRFRREVEAVGRLAHPNIVPIHTVGEERGIPYCALELVEGASLEELLRTVASRQPAALRGRDLDTALAEVLRRRGHELPAGWSGPFAARSWTEACVTLAWEVAGALRHAHERGVLHRDIKPSNVMVARDGRARLIDFGLASLQGAERVTRSGSELGSLPYMAPEQIQGHGASPGADVYGLGVTLYELLTLRHPFLRDNAERTRTLILEGQAAAPRTLNHELARDVETVCLHAMDRDSRRRYASAAAFERDLQNLREHRPIEARRVGPALRMLRLAQRRPAAAVALALGLLLFTVGPLGWAINTSWAMRRVERERVRAEQHFERAFDSITYMLHAMGGEGLRNTPQLQLARLEVLDRAIALMQALEQERSGDPRVREELGRLHRTRADVAVDQGSFAQAAAEYVASQQLFEALESEGLGTAETAWQLTGVINQRAVCALQMGETEAAVELLTEAAARFGELSQRYSQDPRFVQGRATTLSNLGDDLAALNRIPEAREALFEAVELFDGLLRAQPDDGALMLGLALAHESLAELLFRERDRVASEQHSAECVALYQSLFERTTQDRDAKERLASGLSTWSVHQAERGDLAASLESIERSLELRRELVDDFGEIRRYGIDLNGTLINLGVHHLIAGDLVAALEAYREAAEGLEAFVLEFPQDLELRALTAQTHANQALLLVNTQAEWEEVEAHRQRVEELLAPCIESDPLDVGQRLTLSRANYAHGVALCHADRLVDARLAIEEFERADLDWLGVEMLWHAADLWAERVLSVRRSQPAGQERDEAEREGLERTYGYLERATDSGFDDLQSLRANQAFDSLRDHPRYRAVEQRLEQRQP